MFFFGICLELLTVIRDWTLRTTKKCGKYKAAGKNEACYGIFSVVTVDLLLSFFIGRLVFWLTLEILFSANHREF